MTGLEQYCFIISLIIIKAWKLLQKNSIEINMYTTDQKFGYIK